MDLGIKNKVAFITGGSRGLGKAAAISLAKEGVNIGICGRTQSSLDSTIDDLKTLGVQAEGFIADISNMKNLEKLHKDITNKLGQIDILVNNVGGSKSKGDFTETSLNGFQETFSLNLFGSFEMM